MTNREWLMTLSTPELAQYITHEIPIISLSYNNSEKGLEQWLDKEYKETTYLKDFIQKHNENLPNEEMKKLIQKAGNLFVLKKEVDNE